MSVSATGLEALLMPHLVCYAVPPSIIYGGGSLNLAKSNLTNETVSGCWMRPIEFKQFQGDLEAAVVAGAPLEIGDDSAGVGGKLTLAKLDQMQYVIQPHLDKNESLDQILAAHPDFPKRYKSALQVFHQTGSMTTVLDGLATRKIAQRQVGRTLRWAFVYLMVLLAVAFAGLFLYSSKVVPVVNNMQADMTLPSAINVDTSNRIDVTRWSGPLVLIFGGSLVGLLLWSCVGGASRIAMWLGGTKYVRCQTSKTALRTLEMMVENESEGAAISDANRIGEWVTTCCDLVGADTTVRQEVQHAARTPSDLGSLSDYMGMSANHKLAYLKVATPIGLVTVFGGLVALSYCFVILWPIFLMLRDLSTIGT